MIPSASQDILELLQMGSSLNGKNYHYRGRQNENDRVDFVKSTPIILILYHCRLLPQTYQDRHTLLNFLTLFCLLTRIPENFLPVDSFGANSHFVLMCHSLTHSLTYVVFNVE